MGMEISQEILRLMGEDKTKIVWKPDWLRKIALFFIELVDLVWFKLKI